MFLILVVSDITLKSVLCIALSFMIFHTCSIIGRFEVRVARRVLDAEGLRSY